MAELPYFKFYVGRWINGSITLESDSVQGLFVNICAHYWFNQGKLTLSEMKKRLVKSDEKDFDAVIACGDVKVKNDKIKIAFLDEQLKEREHQSITNSKNGALGGRPQSEKKPTALISVSETKAKKSNKEEEKNKKRKEEIKIPFVGEVLVAWNEWIEYRRERKLPNTNASIKKQIKFLAGRPDDEIKTIIDSSIRNNWQGLFEIKNNNNGQRNNTTTAHRTTDAIIQEGKPFGAKAGF